MDEGKTVASTLDSNLIELDPRFKKSERKEQKKEKKDPFNVEILCPIPNGDFELIPFGDDPSRCFKHGKGIPEHARALLITCLRENVDVFAWSTIDMPDIDLNVACHQLTISSSASVVAQRRRKQFPEKAESAEKAVKDLLEANFIATQLGSQTLYLSKNQMENGVYVLIIAILIGPALKMHILFLI